MKMSSRLLASPFASVWAVAIAVIAVSLDARGQSVPTIPDGLDLSIVRSIPVQTDGRWAPLDTLARSIVTEIKGKSAARSEDAVLSLLGWTIEPQAWMHQPLIPIRNAELRGELGLPVSQEWFSYAELVNDQRLRDLMDDLMNVPRGEKLDPLQSKVSDISGKLNELDAIFRGAAIRLVPNATDENGAWRTVETLRQGGSGQLASASAAWASLERAYLSRDPRMFESASTALRDALAALPSAHKTDAKLIATELRMNSVHAFGLAWPIMAVGAMFAALSLVTKQRWLSWIGTATLVAGFLVLSYGLYLRWSVAGRIPAANMFESLLFLSWGAGAFAILSMLLMHDKTVPMTASVMGALALYLADTLSGLDSFIRPIPPVLMDTVWMTIHVPVIMVSYAVLAIAMLIAHGQLAVMAIAPRQRQWIQSIDRMHYWYMHIGSILLMAGIVTGSMWAASSWGRYWGWDPKEVWSLIAFLAYLTILHVRIDTQKLPAPIYVLGAIVTVVVFALAAIGLEPLTTTVVLSLCGALAALAFFVLVQSEFATAVKSVVAFWGIIMTYVGVNFVLGTGLHSYGFGTGAVKKYMFMTAGFDLAFVALCGLIYLARRQPSGRAPVSAARA